MKANCWHGKERVRIDEKPEPTIVEPGDAVFRVTLAAICGSDLHLYDGLIPTMEPGEIMGHEFMGEIVDVGSGVRKHKVRDRVVVAFPISCGECFFCTRHLYSCRERTNPNHELAERLWGHSPAGLYGYSHAVGGYAGGQAELSDEQVLFLSEIFPTGYMAADNCNITAGDTVAVWGCGPVGQFAIASAEMLGAGRVIAIDCFETRLAMAKDKSGADVVIN